MVPAAGTVPERGLRTQVVMATGSGKTLVAAQSAHELQAGRVLVLVPSLDLLAQTEAAWREAGRTGPMIGVSSLRGEGVGFPNTTDVGELVDWVRSFDKVTVFATYASLGLGTLERAHRGGLPGWDLIVVDEAHRTSGRIGKPWAIVHDNARIPSLRRLYMTATPRLWQLGEKAAGAPGELVASMEDDSAGPFGSRAFTLTLPEAIDRGICAPYQVVCVDITDTQLQAAQLLGVEGRSDEVRGARLAALQTALLKASSEEGFRRTLVFHHLVKEAEAFAAGLPEVAAKLHAGDPVLYPKTVWAEWLCGEHKPVHRRRVLGEFTSGIATDDTVVKKGFLRSSRPVVRRCSFTDESERAVQAAIDGEMELLDPEVRASPARVLELLDPEFTEIGASGRRWDVESIFTVTSGGSVSPGVSGQGQRNVRRRTCSGHQVAPVEAGGLVVVHDRATYPAPYWSHGHQAHADQPQPACTGRG
ncbi:DEAD/DEAH box helicase family protein [Streptomyces sp. NPDC053750]|uniref:DEAD/DEAH box helicase family protein n=1 Tax=Streptomyces sp. NPDC053750 TaxID=3365714 RepID=UPI0037D02E35